MSDIVKGDVIMLFIKKSDTWQAIAYGKSHELSISMNTKNVHSRDHDKWTYFRPEYSEWSISCDYLYSEDADCLFDLFERQDTVYVMLGLSSNYDVNGIVDTDNEWSIEEGYKGKAIITSISINAEDGDAATLRCELNGISKLSKELANFEEEPSTGFNPEKLDPTLEFTFSSSITTNSEDNKYKLSDFTELLNPDNLPLRFTVEPMTGTLED